MKKKMVMRMFAVIGATLILVGCANNTPNEESKEVEAINSSSVVATEEETKEREINIDETTTSSSVEESTASTNVDENVVLQEFDTYYKGIDSSKDLDFEVDDDLINAYKVIELTTPIDFYFHSGEYWGTTKENITLTRVHVGAKWTSIQFEGENFLAYVLNEDLAKSIKDTEDLKVATNNTSSSTSKENKSNTSSGSTTTTKEENKPSSNESSSQGTTTNNEVVDNSNNSYENTNETTSNEVVETWTPEPEPTPVVEEPAPVVEAPTTRYSNEEAVAIVENTLRSAGLVKPEDKYSQDLIDMFGPTAGMGYGDVYVSNSNPEATANDLLGSYQLLGYGMYYLEVIGSDENGVTLRAYYGTNY